MHANFAVGCTIECVLETVQRARYYCRRFNFLCAVYYCYLFSVQNMSKWQILYARSSIRNGMHVNLNIEQLHI